jgi:hypothetical protein
MTTTVELLRQGRRDEIWKKHCGFIDLSQQEFMEIQKDLLKEQFQLLGRSELGRKLLGGKVPASMDEFRQNVPLTTYKDYVPYLPEKREDVLPEKPCIWVCTSGRSGEYGRKWIPYTEKTYAKTNVYSLSVFMFGSSNRRDDFVFEEGDVTLATLAPPPYVSGWAARGMLKEFPLKYIPPLEKAEQMEFQARIEEGFKLALKEGIDLFYGISSVLVKIGEQFERQSGGMDKRLLLHPRAMARVVKGLIKSKLAGRPLLPKDLWSVKAIAAGGTDTPIYRDRIVKYWGRPPVEAYAATEAGMIAMQTWGTGLTFVPDMNFLEFVPEDEWDKSSKDPNYQPRTLLLDQVTPGSVYEIVVTNFNGGPFVRYRLGDLIKIIALGDEKAGVRIPQMIFHSRADDIIDLSSFARLTEITIFQALANAKVDFVDWTCVKEIEGERPRLHLYIELSGDRPQGKDGIGEAVHHALQDLDPEYRDWVEMLDGQPPHVTLLSRGTFVRFVSEKQAAGADLAHLKPVRMKPSAVIVSDLMRLSEQRTP